MRGSPFVARPGFVVEERIEEIVQQRVRFVIDPLGPSKFKLRPVQERGSFIVSIGTSQMCTCRDAELCTHVLYVMMRYFGVPKDCDVLWQTSLTDHEIELILDGRVKRQQEPRKQPVYRTKSGKSKVRRLPIADGDVCPICYDSLTDCERAKVAWCRLSCGGNFHRSCVKAWIEARRASGDPPTCPMCHEPLDMLSINTSKPKPPPRDAPPALRQSEMRDLMLRDITPDDYHLLMRLDEQPRPKPPPRPRPQNQRIRAANRILAQPPQITLEVTGMLVANEAPACPHQRDRHDAPLRRDPIRAAPFIAKITGTGLTEQEERPRVTRTPSGQLGAAPAPWRGAGGGELRGGGVRNGIPPRRPAHQGARQPADGADVDFLVSAFGPE
jgi:hypothetical protein